ncbi:tetratricopeptide repeat protein [Streptomyces iconiensis]|uniref:Serine/threonine-protein kinase n=1 Tax=Streptomyces iconiensis TaxID=1384038 RepID=A0ABT6ZRS4_9ACTN|nr:tetratricopeptide repeat-containing serine/threonine-protein kinase [Streptomyces iconiensis]MDJ1131484.1 serine/threonine-protein kinase [Streptomyces iconiensis]
MAENTLIQGRYRLLDLIGRGGMGEVWRARDESLGRRVAVKCLKPLAEHGDKTFMRVLRERFRREARVAAALQHRGVTVVHDFGEHEGLLYLVMELLEGRNLSQLLEDNKQHPLPVTEVIEVAEQVAAALAYTHDQGIVHRDLKPANVMRTEDGTVKICDFGIARLGHDIGFTAKLTGGGIAMGTPHYMSPEQIAGAVVDHRSDLYSLGCVLYEIATGAPPFDNDDAWSVLVGHRDTEPRPPRDHRPELPVPLETVILGLLAKQPEQRPGGAAELTRGLAAARAGAAVTAGTGTLAPDPGPGPGPGAAAAPRQAAPLWLPSWTRGMGSGSRASGSWALGTATPPTGLSGLTGQWTGLKGPVKPPLAGIPDQGGPPAVSARLRPRTRSGDSTRAPHRHPNDPRTRNGPHSPQGPAASQDPLTAQTSREAPPRELVAVLASRHNAGLSLGRLGRWEEAGEVHRAVAAEREQALGPCHPDTLASRYESGFTLSRLGRHDEALGEYTRVAAGRATALGADHPDTLAAQQESAYVLGQLGRHTEAHEVYAEVLAARIRTMGPDHPDTLRCRHNLAFNLSRLGRLEDSYAMAREVADARVRVLGADHPDTLVTRYEVGYALGRLGRWDEALATYRVVDEARTRTLGPDHPDTLAARYESGVCLGRLGRSAEALELYRDLARTRIRAQGPADPETLRALHGLGVNLGRLGRWEEALAQAREVCAARESALGPDHSDTLVSRREIAVGLGWLGRWDEALEVYRHVAAVRERVLGPDHPDTLASRNDEAHCLEQLGRSGEAVEVYREVAAVTRQRDGAKRDPSPHI